MIRRPSIATFRGPIRGARALVGLYLIELLTRLYSEGYDHTNEMVRWKLELLSALENASLNQTRMKEVA